MTLEIQIFWRELIKYFFSWKNKVQIKNVFLRVATSYYNAPLELFFVVVIIIAIDLVSLIYDWNITVDIFV